MTVHDRAVSAPDISTPSRDSSPLHELRKIIEHAAHLLPAQGPITAFVHHNTLHAFEDMPFDQAVQQGAEIFGCEPYLPEEKYREFLQDERITTADLREVLLGDLGDYADVFVGRLGTRYYLRLAMLQYPLRMASKHELRWLVAQTDALRRFRPESPPDVSRRMIEQTRHWMMRDLRYGGSPGSTNNETIRETVARILERSGNGDVEQWSSQTWEAFCLQLLWQVCRQGVLGLRQIPKRVVPMVRHRDYLLRAARQDSDRLVHDLLIRFSAAYLDQGLANWTLPHRKQGFFHAFVSLYRQGGSPPDRWLRGLRDELQRLSDAHIGPLESIAESLETLGVRSTEREQYISASLLALRGWAGMLWQAEIRGDRVSQPAPEGSLVGFLAVRLILERMALSHVARTALRYRGRLQDLRDVLGAGVAEEPPGSIERRAFQVFQLAQIREWTPQQLHGLSPSEWSNLVHEIESFPALERRRVFQHAYERRYRIQTLDAVATHSRQVASRTERPQYQVICCIDEREESFRRHLEEIAPACETLGAAGFFGVAMYYQGAGDAHFAPLCPAIILPKHYVKEEVVYTFEESHRRRARTRQVIGAASHQMHVGSRTFAGGALLALLGSLASVPLVARILFPWTSAQIRRMFGSFVELPPVTKLQLERTEPDAGPQNGHVGYTLPEMAGIVERLLRDLGMASRFSPLVIVMGHGSSSLNNPHEAAHDCGACGGARGGPNARAFAEMANDPRVRSLVAAGGLQIPSDTVFVGAYHNTCDDRVTYFDLDRLPATHREIFEVARRDVGLACERSAHERSRRFESAPLNLTTEAALRHVEGRAEDLAQTRPEYGHATNAICFVGRRWKTRGLFLDRRAFLTSYDPDEDDVKDSVLTRILQAVVPVCGGISLEYYFSFVDSAGYGCGTKLPHNITSLLGVMDGAASDLRPGLPWQMVEIHEPVRLLFVIETTPQSMLQIMDAHEAIGRLCRNEWIQLAVQDPVSGEIFVFRRGVFELHQPESCELPVVRSSIDWYRGWRSHLGFASVKMQSLRSGTGRPAAERRRV